jgi:hypothetical protein
MTGVRSGSNWTYLRARLHEVLIRTTQSGQRVAEVRLALPLGRERERTVMIVPTITWHIPLAERLAQLPAGLSVQVVGHVSARRWTPTAGGPSRLAAEIQIDNVALDIGDAWRESDPASTNIIIEKEMPS